MHFRYFRQVELGLQPTHNPPFNTLPALSLSTGGLLEALLLGTSPAIKMGDNFQTQYHHPSFGTTLFYLEIFPATKVVSGYDQGVLSIGWEDEGLSP